MGNLHKSRHGKRAACPLIGLGFRVPKPASVDCPLIGLLALQGVAVRGYARDFVAASEHMGFLVEDLVIHGKLEEAMSLLEMSVPHYLIEEYNDDDDGDGSGGNGEKTVGKLKRYTKAPEKPPTRDIREVPDSFHIDSSSSSSSSSSSLLLSILS
jgi:hypothetical protein